MIHFVHIKLETLIHHAAIYNTTRCSAIAERPRCRVR